MIVNGYGKTKVRQAFSARYLISRANLEKIMGSGSQTNLFFSFGTGGRGVLSFSQAGVSHRSMIVFSDSTDLKS